MATTIFVNNDKTEKKSYLTFRKLYKGNPQIFHVSFIFIDKHFNLAGLCDFRKAYQSYPAPLYTYWESGCDKMLLLGV